MFIHTQLLQGPDTEPQESMDMDFQWFLFLLKEVY